MYTTHPHLKRLGHTRAGWRVYTQSLLGTVGVAVDERCTWWAERLAVSQCRVRSGADGRGGIRTSRIWVHEASVLSRTPSAAEIEFPDAQIAFVAEDRAA